MAKIPVKIPTNETISVLGSAENNGGRELRCPWKCGDEDVSVDPNTGICSVCGRVYTIHFTRFIYTEPIKV